MAEEVDRADECRDDQTQRDQVERDEPETGGTQAFDQRPRRTGMCPREAWIFDQAVFQLQGFGISRLELLAVDLGGRRPSARGILRQAVIGLQADFVDIIG